MTYLFYFGQKSADRAVFWIFYGKKIKFQIFQKIEPIQIFGQLHWIQWALIT